MYPVNVISRTGRRSVKTIPQPLYQGNGMAAAAHTLMSRWTPVSSEVIGPGSSKLPVRSGNVEQAGDGLGTLRLGRDTLSSGRASSSSSAFQSVNRRGGVVMHAPRLDSGLPAAQTKRKDQPEDESSDPKDDHQGQ